MYGMNDRLRLNHGPHHRDTWHEEYDQDFTEGPTF